MFQLLSQIAGRAGRESKGKVLIQAYNKNAKFLQALLTDDLENFYAEELLKREKYYLPPYSKLVALIINSTNKLAAENIAQELSTYLKKIPEVRVLGPVAAPIFFLRKQYRYRILLKLSKELAVAEIFQPIKGTIDKLKQVSVKIEVDPVNFM